MIRKYHNHKPQTTLWHLDLRKSRSTIKRHQEDKFKQSNQLSLPRQDDCNTRMDINEGTTKHRTKPKPFCNVASGMLLHNVRRLFIFSQINTLLYQRELGSSCDTDTVYNQINKYFGRKIVNIFLYTNLNSCCGCSKEPSH